jgi:hypothetical protein
VSKKIQIALNLLNGLVAQGMEYPDAHSFAVTSTKLNDREAEKLAELYDTDTLGTYAEKSAAGLPLSSEPVVHGSLEYHLGDLIALIECHMPGVDFAAVKQAKAALAAVRS